MLGLIAYVGFHRKLIFITAESHRAGETFLPFNHTLLQVTKEQFYIQIS